MSPILFIFFINDIVSCVNTDTDMFSIDDIYVFMLLYADDAVVFAKSAESLQNILNNIQDYCDTWNLTINTSKTKVMVFEKGIDIPSLYFILMVLNGSCNIFPVSGG